jgi:hypothetical protein
MREKLRKKTKIVIGYTPVTFEVHVSLIMEEEMERNRLRQQKIFFDRQKPPQASHKMCGCSNAPTTFQ